MIRPALRTPANRTVLRFLEDPTALGETWVRRWNDAGGIGDTPECGNAGHAKERVIVPERERAVRSLQS